MSKAHLVQGLVFEDAHDGAEDLELGVSLQAMSMSSHVRKHGGLDAPPAAR